MLPDVNKYVRHLDDFDLTNREKTELIHTLWQIMGSFVERAFAGEKAPVSLAAPQDRDSVRPLARVESKEQPNHKPLRESFARVLRRDRSRRDTP